MKYKKLAECRTDRDLKQKDIAELLKTTQQTYSLWETGEREIPVRHLITLALFYNVSLDYLVGLPEGRPYGHSKTKKIGASKK